MTTDTKPTDAEIDALWRFEASKNWDSTLAMRTSFARAVLARWGQLAHSGEPVYAFRRKGLDDFCTCTEKRYAELSAKPNLFETRIFYTAPQPVEREPLTDEQIDAAAKKLAECMEYPWEYMPEPGRKNMRKHAQAVLEAAHGIGIKGGQHGAE